VTARLITEYGIAFLDRYLKGDAGPMQRLTRRRAGDLRIGSLS
jgi:hypothetical protein